MPSELMLIAIVVLALSIAMTMFRVRRRIDKLGESEEKLQRYVREQSKVIRALARETLGFRRQISKITLSNDLVSDECLRLEGRLKEAQKIDRRIYVLDDRRSPNDQTWIVSIMHQNYKAHVSPNASLELSQLWAKGRRFVVWAVDRDRALDKVNIKMPKEQGFVVSSIDQKEVNA